VSKPATIAGRSPASPENWRRRLFRNTYRRAGRTRELHHWSVKIQHRGVRRTLTLRAGDPDAAAREAAALYQRIIAGGWAALPAEPPPHGSSGESAAPAAASGRSKTAAQFARLRLTTRARPGGGEIEDILAHLDHAGRSHHFPLGTAEPAEALRRARRIQRALASHGLDEACRRFARELTLALHWSANPVAWTYFTLQTAPGEPAGQAPLRARPAEQRTVAIVEPDSALAAAIGRQLAGHAGFAWAATFHRATEALAALGRQPVALMLVNHTLDGVSGADFLERLRRLAPQAPGLIYSAYADSDELFKATPGGAIGYLLKRTPPRRFLEPLLGLARHETISAEILAARTQAYFQKLIGSPPPGAASLEMAKLTPRELEILGQLRKGFLDKEIAGALRISVWTVHGHVKNIFEKLGVRSRTEAVVKYLQR